MELLEYLDQEFASASEERERFRVQDEQQANWCLRKIAAAKAELERKKNLAEAEIFRIQSWLAAEQDKLSGTIDYMTALLEEYHRPLYEADPKQNKTISLPCGKLQWRKVPTKFERDEDKLVECLMANQMTDFIETRFKPRWGELKKQVVVKDGFVYDQETGLLLDGVRAIELGEEFKVIVDGGEST